MVRFRPILHGLLLCGALAFAAVAASGSHAGENPDGWGDPDDHDGWGGHDPDGWDGHDADHDGWDGHDHDHDAPAPDGAEHVRQKLAAKFDVHESVITRLRNRGLGYGEIDHTLTLASGMEGGLTKHNVREVLKMRQEQGLGWGQIAHELDTTMGAAKRDFRSSPPPSDGDGTHDPDGSAMHSGSKSESPGIHSGSKSGASVKQPTSVGRSGRSSFAKGSGASAGRLGARSFARSGSTSGGRITGASAGRANGHAFGGAASNGGGSRSNGGGKAKGRR
jgi:hypothetical protein